MPDKTIIALPENVVLVRCFDPDIDVALHAIKKIMKRAGCKRVREMPLTGGAISFGQHLDFVDSQIRTFIDRGFTGIILTVHNHCHHIKANKMLPENFDECAEHDFLKQLLLTGMQNIHQKFPEITTVITCIIDTKEADSGVKSVKHFFSSCNHGVKFEFHNESDMLNPILT